MDVREYSADVRSVTVVYLDIQIGFVLNSDYLFIDDVQEGNI